MKRIIATALTIVILVACFHAYAEDSSIITIDLKNATTEELNEADRQIQAELRARINTKIVLDHKEATIEKGKKLTITATIEELPDDVESGKLSWKSSDENVANCKNGTVTGKNPGTATIECTTTLSDGTELKETCIVTVIIPVRSLKAQNNKIELGPKSTMEIEIEIKPQDASITTLTYESDDPSVATVDKDGKVTGIAIGTTEIHVKATDGSNQETTVSVAVKSELEEQEILFLDIPWDIPADDVKTALQEKELCEKFEAKAADTVTLIPQADKIGEELGSTKAKKEYLSKKGNGYAGGFSIKPDKLIGGLQATKISFSFYYGVNSDGTANPLETHLFSTYVTFKRSQNGSKLVETLELKYGEPEIQKKTNSRFAYIWTGRNDESKLVLFYDLKKPSYLLYVNTRISDLAQTMIKAHEPIVEEPVYEDAGI